MYLKRTLLAALAALLALPLVLLAPSSAAAAGGGSVQVVYSSYNNTDTNNRLTAQPSKSLTAIDQTSADATIVVDPSITYQPWIGFGGSLEHDSIWELNRLSAADRSSALRALFDPATGNNYNLMRLAIACPDFCPDYDTSKQEKGYWTYDDMPAGQTDPTLAHFSVQRDIDLGVFSMLQEILTINPSVKFYASLWSPPAWMKDSGSLLNGGHVKPEFYGALANYYVKYIQAYRDRGIPIYAVTLQNEPAISVGYPSTLWTTDEQMNFAQTLGQIFAANNIKTKIWGLDDNEQNTFDYAKTLANPASAQYVEGMGFHNYTGQTLYQGTPLHAQYPDKTMHLTEITNGAAKLIEYMRNWMSSYSYWLTFIEFVNPGPGPGFWQNENRDPAQDPDFWVDSQVSWTGTPGSSSYKLNAWYYTFGQFSRFIQPGAVRIDSTGTVASDVTNVAFRNPDGTNVVIVVNRRPSDKNATDMNTSAKTIKLITPDGQIADTIPGDTVATYKWTSTTGDALPRAEWTSAASNTNGAFTAMQAIDGNAETWWTSGANEASGQTFTLNLGSQKTFDQVTLNLGKLSADVPASYVLGTSNDGTNWSDAATGHGTSGMTNIGFASLTAQYIRVQLTGAAAHWWSIADVSVYDGTSGLLPRAGWTASASATGGADAAANALDGNPATRWTNGTAQAPGQWLQVDMGAVRSFNKLSIDAGANAGDYARGYSVSVSADGANWSAPLATGIGRGQTIEAYVPTQSARYIRISQTGTASNWWTASELRVYKAAPSLLDRSGWTATASVSAGDGPASAALDGSLSSRWATGAAQSSGQWFRADLGKIQSIAGIALNAGSFAGDYPRGYKVDLSLDGTNWQTVAEGATPAQDVMIAFPTNFARYVKVTQTGSASANYWSIAEFNVFGAAQFPSPGTRLSHAGWTATASHTESGGNPNVALDGWLQAPRNAPYDGSVPIDNAVSRWTSGKAQLGNEWFQVDLGAAQTFDTVELNAGPAPGDYPRAYTVYVSNDGSNWTPVASGEGAGAVARVSFAAVTARYVNVNQTGTAGSNWWTIAEFNLYRH
ncbi:O-Glycosyl hydrolase [Cohnella sp. OV330]|uniref:discoidin domain-containing protein n=1 Tax=Cohnella sp. OV330 TaxID=1855288 RepID=UPI0008ED8CE6|nr:discoidin domain-containing protein [Cohnella sp. OV330]SFB06111.1 O-Glycosyl hydrolase [Cohnella sp. OV330]